MTIQQKLIATSKSLCLIVGSVVISYCLAAFIAWAGARYYGDFEAFMQVFRAAGGYLTAWRILFYGALIYLWLGWKRSALLHSDSPARSRQSARRIELLCAVTLIVLELSVWQSDVAGGQL